MCAVCRGGAVERSSKREACFDRLLLRQQFGWTCLQRVKHSSENAFLDTDVLEDDDLAESIIAYVWACKYMQGVGRCPQWRNQRALQPFWCSTLDYMRRCTRGSAASALDRRVIAY